MPYYHDFFEVDDTKPIDWEHLEEIWNLIKNDLLDFHFETKDDALVNKNAPSSDKGERRYSSWSLVRFRKSDDEEMLRGMHDMGLEALAYVEHYIENKIFDMHLLRYWGQLTACHGYVLCAALAKSNDLSHDRAGLAGGKATTLDKHKQWFSHYYFKFGKSIKERKSIEGQIVAVIKSIVSDPETTQADKDWFFKFFPDGVNEDNIQKFTPLKNAFSDRKFYKKHMEELIKRPSEDLPFLDKTIPDP
ncbi:MAG: hypothetical protein ABJK46_01565 [Ekhidna sp.]